MARNTGKLDKKELRHDPFQDWVWNAVGWLHRYQRPLIATGIAVVVVAAGVGGYLYYRHAQARAELRAFHEAERPLRNPELAAEQRTERARQSLAAFLEAHPDGRLSEVARMLLAELAWAQEDYAAAAQAFRQVSASGGTWPLKPELARLGVAKALEAQGELEQSVQLYEALPPEQMAALKAIGLGRVAVARGDAEAARQHFEAVIKDNPGSPLAAMAREALAYLP